MSRHYPSTRDRITRALNEGAKVGHGRYINRYKYAASGRPLWRAFRRGWWLAFDGSDPYLQHLPVVDLSHEFADLTAEIEAHPPKCLEGGI